MVRNGFFKCEPFFEVAKPANAYVMETPLADPTSPQKSSLNVDIFFNIETIGLSQNPYTPREDPQALPRY